MAGKKSNSGVSLITDKESLIAHLNNKYGEGVVRTGGMVVDVDVVPLGSIAFNEASGVWGMAKGKLIHVEGPQHSGKSTLCLETIAAFQREGVVCAYVDHEYSFDRTYAENVGVNVEDLLILQPDTQEDSYNAILDLLKTGIVGLITVDSLNGMVPKARLEGEVGDQFVALEQRLHSQTLPQIKQFLSKTNATLIGVAQSRAKIGAMTGPQSEASGGNAWKFFADVRIKVSQVAKKVDDGYNEIQFEFTKNKLARPYLKRNTFITYGIGIDALRELVYYGEQTGVIKRAGSHYSYGDVKLGAGIANVSMLLSDNDELYQEILAAVYQKLKNG